MRLRPATIALVFFCCGFIGASAVWGQGGAISGRVFDRQSGASLAGVEVRVGPFFDVGIEQLTVTDADGHYSFEQVVDGLYDVSTGGTSMHLPQAWDRVTCLFVCKSGQGFPIEVDATTVRENLDFPLERSATITGRVTDHATGLPIAGAWVNLEGNQTDLFGGDRTDADGTYRIGKLPPATYQLSATFGPQGVIFDDMPCLTPCGLGSGTPIVLALGELRENIDFSIRNLGGIAGTVTREIDDTPIEQARIEAYDVMQGLLRGSTVTTSDGRYLIPDLPAGAYHVVADNLLGPEIDELYDDIVCPQDFGGCSLAAGTPVDVVLEQVTTDIDFALGLGGSFSGRATDESSGAPLANASVWARLPSGDSVDVVQTDANGDYTVAGLTSGTYHAVVSDSGHLAELYDDVPCFAQLCPVTAGTPIPVTFDQNTPGIDFALDRGGVIAGRVTDSLTGQGVEGVEINVFNQNEHRFTMGFTDADGFYQNHQRLPVGNYYVVASHPAYRQLLYPDVPCADGLARVCDFPLGTTVAVAEDQVTANVDLAIDRRPGDCTIDRTLALREGRFQVEVDWRTAQGDDGCGHATAVPGIDDSGSFWFFNPRNLELVVKVLDGCNTPFESFWVFAAGLTDVQTTITVTDTSNGEVATYENPLGTSFQPVQDTRAFSCNNTLIGPSVRPSPITAETEQGADRVIVAATTHEKTALPAPPPVAQPPGSKMATCVADDTTLCLESGRFEVRTAWRTHRGDEGIGHAVPLTADTGFFWFFNPNNLEMVVKALDGCNTVFESFWLFAGGLTNVEVTMTVTDTVSGEEKVYLNPQGTPFVPILDTRAFATCGAP